MDKLKEDKIITDLLPQTFGKQGKIWVISLLFFAALGYLPMEDNCIMV